MSFLVAVYNGAEFVDTCLASVKAQTFADWELIVIDDASNDDTVSRVGRWTGENIRLIRLGSNQGPSAARNAGAKEARGRYLAILDIDDVALPQRLEKQVAFLDSHPDHAAVGCWFKLESAMGNSVVTQRPLTDHDIRRKIVWSFPMVHSGLTMRTTAFSEIGGYQIDHDHGEDYRLVAALAARYKVANLKDVLVVKREFKDGLTFRLSPWRHFLIGLRTRIAVAQTMTTGPIGYAVAFAAACGILVVRTLNLNRETIKRSVPGVR